MKKIIKDLTYSVLTLSSKDLEDSASILMYHSIGDNEAFFTVQKKKFEQQLRHLTHKKVSVIALSELVRRLEARESISNCVVITFDDGYEDNYSIAYPLLKHYNLPATIFLITGLVNKEFTNSQGITLSMLREEQIREMHQSGLVEFMPHSHDHVVFTEASPQKISQSIIESREYIHTLLGSEGTIFAYPKGKYTEDHISLLKDAGYKASVTVQGGLIHSEDNLFTLKRNAVDSQTNHTQFRAMVSKAIEVYKKMKPS